MEEEILQGYSDAHITLTEGRGGVFEIRLDTTMVFSKYAQGRFPHPMEIIGHIKDLV